MTEARRINNPESIAYTPRTVRVAQQQHSSGIGVGADCGAYATIFLEYMVEGVTPPLHISRVRDH